MHSSLNRLTPVLRTSFKPPQLRRSFPTSYVRSYASEARTSPFQSFLQPDSLFDKIQNNPGVLQAIQQLARIAKDKTGVDLQGGQKPTFKMMTQLASDPELKEAAENLMASLQAAGIEVDPRQAFEALKIMGEGFENVGDLSEIKSSKGWPGNDDEGNKGSRKA